MFRGELNPKVDIFSVGSVFREELHPKMDDVPDRSSPKDAPVGCQLVTMTLEI